MNNRRDVHAEQSADGKRVRCDVKRLRRVASVAERRLGDVGEDDDSLDALDVRLDAPDDLADARQVTRESVAGADDIDAQNGPAHGQIV